MRYEALIDELTGKYALPVGLIAAVARQESYFDQTVVSRAGAIGLMQLMPDTAKWLGVDPNKAESNLCGGAMYLRKMHDKYPEMAPADRLRFMLASYNWGPGNVAQARHAIKRAGGYNRLYTQLLPYLPKETKKYVQRVLDFMQQVVSGKDIDPGVPLPDKYRVVKAVKEPVVAVSTVAAVGGYILNNTDIGRPLMEQFLNVISNPAVIVLIILIAVSLWTWFSRKYAAKAKALKAIATKAYNVVEKIWNGLTPEQQARFDKAAKWLELVKQMYITIFGSNPTALKVAAMQGDMENIVLRSKGVNPDPQ